MCDIEVARALKKRYPSMSHDTFLKILTMVCAYLSRNLGDANARQRLCETNNNIYWQQFSEVLFGHSLLGFEFNGLTHNNGVGPDFLIEKNGQKIWIEVITPEPKGLPDEWINHRLGASSLPHEAMLLRWTAAIKEKCEKLNDYIKKKIVGLQDCYVIAVNSRLLRAGGDQECCPQLFGISQFPFAAEVVLPVGPLQATVDQDNKKLSTFEHSYREKISKPSGANVPTQTFLKPEFKNISAIWAADIDESLVVVVEQRFKDMVVIHNPKASNPLPKKILPAQAEYIAIESNDGFSLRESHRY